jgi:hypothetical protein
VKYEPITEFSPERCEILARVIEQQPHSRVEDADGFNMSAIHHECGSPCCISGFAANMLTECTDFVYAIAQFIGCENEEAIRLHCGDFARGRYMETITPAEAAAALRALAAKRQGAQQ